MLLINILFFLGSILNFHLKIFNQFSFIEMLIIFLLSSISIYFSLNFLLKTNFKSLNFNKILSTFFIHILILTVLFANGTIGNPNNAFKDFIYQSDLKKLIKNNPIFLIGELDDKNINLLKFYLPKFKLIKTKEIPENDTIYGIINDKDLNEFNDSLRSKYINIKEFKNINLIKIN